MNQIPNSLQNLLKNILLSDIETVIFFINKNITILKILMSKNHTQPIIRYLPTSKNTIQSQQTPKSNALSLLKICELSFAQTQPNKNIFFNNTNQQFLNIKELHSEPAQLLAFHSQSDIQNTNKNVIHIKDEHDNKKISKETMIAMELQQNQELRINLFKAEKTIQDLQQICKNLQSKMLGVLSNKKQEIIKKLSDNKIQQYSQRKDKNKDKHNLQKQNNKNSQVLPKYVQIAQIWKSCYSDLVEYINSYTQDVVFLTEQYKLLEKKNKHYKKSNNKSKKNQQNLLKILRESNQKLQKYQNNMQKLFQDLKERDTRIQQYQIQNKNIKMKIIQNFQQIQKLKRDNKIQVRQSISYKQVAKSLQQQVNDLTNKCQQLYTKINNKQKLQQILKSNQGGLQQRITTLQQQLNQTRKFNQNLMQEYKLMSSKIQLNQQKLSEKYQNYEYTQTQKMIQYQKCIQSLKKQIQNNKNQHTIKVLQQEIQELYKVKFTLEKQNSLNKQSLTIIEQELQKQQEIYKRLQTDLQARIQQKDRQIEYLQQLRVISNQKNQQLRSELQEVRSDMVLIIEQLKVKQLQIQKYKYINTPKNIQRSNSIRQILKNSSSSKKIKNSSTNIQKKQNIFNNSKMPNEGIVWKKMKKQSNSAEIQRQNSNQISEIEPDSMPSFKNRRNKNLKVNTQFQSSLSLAEIQIIKKNTLTSDSFNQKQLNQQTQSSKMDTPKSKFSLHAFQNKIIMEENAKFLVQLNKTMFK